MTKTTESETGNETSAIVVIANVTVEVLVDVTDGTVIDSEEQWEN